MKQNIFLNVKEWKSFSEKELKQYKLNIFNYYRENGFPYYPTNQEYRLKEFEKLKRYDRSNLLEDGVLKQTMHGLGLAWSYFPHSFHIQCGSKISPYNAFIDDEKFKQTIEKRLKLGTYISDSGIRKMLKLMSNVQGVSNFRPTAAAAIYDKYAPNGVVWDMSGGWGGRMLGAIISGVENYIMTEPSKKTFKGLAELATNHFNNDFELHPCGSEEFKPHKNSLDLCFTSPPYFNLEKYSTERSQSYIKFENINDWLDGFLKQTFKNCYYGLKNGKHMLINIADPKRKSNNLETETIRIAKEIGFKHIDTLKLALSNPKFKEKGLKYEPIFVFKKI